MVSEAVKTAVIGKLISAIENGTDPWKFYMKSGFLQRNYSEHIKNTNKVYHGFNQLVLSLTQSANQYKTPFWVTHKQATEMGGTVTGGKGVGILAPLVIQDKKTDKTVVKGFRYFTVFNIDQTNLPEPEIISEDTNEPIQTAENIKVKYAEKMKAFVHSNEIAYYSPSEDKVSVPELNSCVSSEEYYSAVFHEFAHRAMSKHDLNISNLLERDREEIYAETVSAIICRHCNFSEDTLSNSASYIDGFLATSPTKLFDDFMRIGKIVDSIVAY